MITVIDTSAAIELILGRSRSKLVLKVIEKTDWLVAPSLYLYESSNVMWKYYNSKLIDLDYLREKIAQCTLLIDEFIPAGELYEEALHLACQFEHPVYDAAYIAACLRKDAGLISFDKRLIKLAKHLKIKVLPTSR